MEGGCDHFCICSRPYIDRCQQMCCEFIRHVIGGSRIAKVTRRLGHTISAKMITENPVAEKCVYLYKNDTSL